jgi:hypothetical protein
MDPRAGLDDLEKRKFLTLRGLELRPLGMSFKTFTKLGNMTGPCGIKSEAPGKFE